MAAKTARMAFKTTAAVNNIEILTKILPEPHKYLDFMGFYMARHYLYLYHHKLLNNVINVIDAMTKKRILKKRVHHSTNIKMEEKENGCPC